MTGLLHRFWRRVSRRRPLWGGDLILTDQTITGTRCWTATLYADTGGPACLRLTLIGGGDLYPLIDQAIEHARRLDIHITAVSHLADDHEVPDDWPTIHSALTTYYGWT